MTWNRLYVLKSYIRGALWIVPFFAVVVFWVFGRIAEAFNRWLVLIGRVDETTAFYGLAVAGARPLLETIITLNISFLVFTFGSLLVAIQVAGGQYTPRIIATTLLRDNRSGLRRVLCLTLLCARVLIGWTASRHQFNIFLVAVGSTHRVFLMDRHAARICVRSALCGGWAERHRVLNPLSEADDPAPLARCGSACRRRSNARIFRSN